MKSSAFYKTFFTEDLYLTARSKSPRIASSQAIDPVPEERAGPPAVEERAAPAQPAPAPPRPLVSQVDVEMKIAGYAAARLLVVLDKREVQGETRALLLKILEQTGYKAARVAFLYTDEPGNERLNVMEIAKKVSAEIILAFGKQVPGYNWNETIQSDDKKILLAPGLRALHENIAYKRGLWQEMKLIF